MILFDRAVRALGRHVTDCIKANRLSYFQSLEKVILYLTLEEKTNNTMDPISIRDKLGCCSMPADISIGMFVYRLMLQASAHKCGRTKEDQFL